MNKVSLLELEEAAAILRISVGNLRQRKCRGILPPWLFVKQGRRLQVHGEKLEEFLNAGGQVKEPQVQKPQGRKRFLLF